MNQGGGDATTLDSGFDLDPDWEQLPDGIRHLDVADVAIDDQDRVHVLTREDAQILVFAPSGEFLLRFASDIFSSRPHGLSSRPHGLTLSPEGLIYCVDEGHHCVYIFEPDGSLCGVLGEPGVASDTGHDPRAPTLHAKTASIVRAGPPFNRPTKLACGPDGQLFVADGYGNCCIHTFSPTGQQVGSWGAPGGGPGEFRLPHSICVTGTGRLLVADRENERIQVFDAGGQFLDSWENVRRPTSIARAPGDGVFVSELGWVPGEQSWSQGPITSAQPARISHLDGDGNLLSRWLSPGDGSGMGEFIAPHGIAVDLTGSIYLAEVAETYRKSRNPTMRKSAALQKFTPSSANRDRASR